MPPFESLTASVVRLFLFLYFGAVVVNAKLSYFPIVNRIAFISILGFLPLYAFSQQADAEAISALKPSFSHQYTFLDDPRYYFIDTSFSSLKTYHRFNNAFSDLFGYNELGNLGAALNPLTLHYDSDPWNYSELGAYQQYFPDQKNIPFYQVRSPLTEAAYWMGYNRGHSFRIYHTQNIKPNWNFLVRYKRLNALGQYNYNRNKQSVFLANTRYHSRDHSYEAKAYFLYSKLDIEENGGIENDTLFEVTNPANKLLVGVNLPQSSTGTVDRRILRKREVYFDQNYDLIDLVRVFQTEDTAAVDTALAENKPNLPSEGNKLLALGHSLRYTTTTKTYQGYSSNFYDSYYFGEGGVTDSIATRELENTLYLQTELGKAKNFMLKAGLRHLFLNYDNAEFGLTSSNLGLTGQAYGRISNRFYIRAHGDLIFLGPLREAFNLGGDADLRLVGKLHAIGGLEISNKLPSLYKQYYRANNFIWNNDFAPEQVQEIQYGLKFKESSELRITNSRHVGYIFYGKDGSPQQAGDPIHLFKVDLKQNFSLWNFLHQDNRVTYQRVIGDMAEVLPLPEVITRNSLYFEFGIFKRALKVLAGAEVKYFTKYYSPSYSPAIGDFYVANERQIGEYPVLDLFMNFKLRKAQIFVKYQHINEGYTGFDYYAAPHYPFADRTLRVGITWRFFN